MQVQEVHDNPLFSYKKQIFLILSQMGTVIELSQDEICVLFEKDTNNDTC